MLLFDEASAWLFIGNVKFYANHQTLTAHIDDMGEVACLHFGGEGVYEVFANLCGILYKLFLFDDIQDSQCSCTAEMIASECGAELPVYRLEFWGDKHAAHRETVADAFGNCDYIGAYIQMLVGEELAASAVATLNFVADKHGVVFVAEFTQTLKELFCDETNAANALYALDDYGTHIAFLYLLLPCGKVVDRQVCNVSIVVDWSDNFRVVRCLYCKGCSAVKSLLHRENACASVVE